ncbi:hypothetical protein WMW72_18005 [Paenibacillus filicis]|uniref:Uncharacterized protein n=1 Tax=Paenibacillus filicis TaxID=669464 RepID=A0ABU9DLR3_9BACL
MMSDKIETYKESWRHVEATLPDAAVQALVTELLEEMERLAGENKRLKTALLKATTAQKPAMSTKLSEALRE